MMKILLASESQDLSSLIMRTLQNDPSILQMTQVTSLSDFNRATREEAFDLILVDWQTEWIGDLWEGEGRYRRLVELSPETIVVYDQEEILYINPAGARLVGIDDLDQLIGRPVSDLIYPAERAALQASIRELFDQGQGPVHQGVARKLKLADGRVRHVEISSAPIVYRGRPARQAIVRDVTERKQAEDALHRRSIYIEALADISQALAEATPHSRNVLDTVVRRTAEIVGDACLLALFTDEAPGLEPLAYYHPDAGAHQLVKEVLAAPASLEETDLVRHTLETEKSLLIPELTPGEVRQRLPAAYRPYVDQVGIYGILVVPVRSRGRLMGILAVTRDGPGRPYTEEDEQFLLNLADRAALNILNARLFETERRRRQELDALSTRLAEIEETQRQQLSRELHDQIGQYLTALNININTVRALIESDADTAQVGIRLDDSESLVEQMVARMRNIMAELRPAVLDDYGLAAALRWYGNKFAERTGIATAVQADSLSPRLESDAETALFRITQEALTNVARHAQADKVVVELKEERATVNLTINDNGVGFAPVDSSLTEAGWGLFIMRERAQAVGGRLQIDTAPNAGVQLTVEVPR